MSVQKLTTTKSCNAYFYMQIMCFIIEIKKYSKMIISVFLLQDAQHSLQFPLFAPGISEGKYLSRVSCNMQSYFLYFHPKFVLTDDINTTSCSTIIGTVRMIGILLKINTQYIKYFKYA